MYITFVCYPESMPDSLENILNALMKDYPSLEYWSILHDKDIDETGEVKKAHFHNVLSVDFKNKSHTIYEKSDIAKMFGRNPEAIEKVNNPTGIIRYLTHCDNNDKYKYDIKDVYTNNFDTIRNAIDIEPVKKSADDELEDLFQWIDSKGLVTKMQLFQYQREKRLFFKFSAVSRIINDYVDLHNESLQALMVDMEIVQALDYQYTDKQEKHERWLLKRENEKREN